MFLATIDGDNTWGTVVPSCIEDVRDLIKIQAKREK